MIALATFACTLLLSGALLFGVQPMIGKLLLPLVGGAPAAWNVCMLFFQCALLAGYGYAWALARLRSRRMQAAIHLSLLAGGLVCLPIALSGTAAASVPREGSPIAWLLFELGRSAGLPFFALAASSPLFGSWFARTESERGGYALFAASNAGSLIGLLGYPTVVEPRFDLAAQARLWAGGYVALIGFVVVAATIVTQAPLAPVDESPAANEGDLSWRRRARWVALAFVPSSLSLGTTTYLATDVASVPLLWVLPLTLYLMSFVLVFAPRPFRPAPWMARGYALLTVCLFAGLLTDSIHSLTIAVPLHLTALFLASLVLHGALAADRPDARHLPEYFAWTAVGGALGGVWNALVAPLVFTSVTEYPLAMILGCWLRPGPADASEDARRRALDVAAPVAATAAFAAAILAAQSFVRARGDLVAIVLFGAAALVCYSFVSRPLRFALGLLGMLAASSLFTTGHGRTIRSERNFFGVVRLTKDWTGSFLQIVHGNTLHGRQALADSIRCVPSVYYHRDGPLGDVFCEVPLPPTAHVAAVGLGAGTIASYARAGEDWTFYEINPAVARMAEHDFSFLSACSPGAATRIVLGDGRLALREAPPALYDRIVLDAFGSDSIPVHLLTREGLAVELAKLAPGGMIAIHLSNSFLDLRPVVAAAAADAKLVALARDDDESVPLTGKEGSRWAALARSDADLGALARDPHWKRLSPAPGARPWTDSYSNLWGAIDWKIGR